MAALRPFAIPLPPGPDAAGWILRAGRRRGFLLLDRPDAEGRPASYLSWEPGPGDPFTWAPPGLDGPAPAPFFGGWAGVLSYDLGRRWERLPARARDEGWPDVAGGIYGWALAVEEGGRRTRLVGAAEEENGGARAKELAEELAALRAAPVPEPADVPLLRGGLRSNLDREAHAAAVRAVVEYIRAGDVFQVNLARRVEGTLAGDPLHLAVRLRRADPAPRGAVVSLGGGRWVISASPELLLEARDGLAVTRPIKGTRRRTGDPAADAAARADLLASGKDAAELAMIVDLHRNDLGRVARWGGVRVREARRVEEQATVLHTLAVIEADLRPGVTAEAILRACFPGGSVTGAPKIRAMEILDEREPVRRGPYCGSAAWIGPDGAIHGNILIRTLAVEGDRVTFGVGGGITAESDPDAEWEETVAKGGALCRALGHPPA